MCYSGQNQEIDMKEKVIRGVLRHKFNAWVKSIDDEPTRTLAKNGTIITGGAIASMLLNEEINDFDLYFKDQETALAITQYYVRKFQDENASTSFDNSVRSSDVGLFVKADDGGRIRIVVKSAGIINADGQDNYEYFESQTLSDPDRIEDYVESAASVLRVDQRAQKEGLKYHPILMTSNAISLTDKVQLIIRFYGDADEIHKNFDFVHCTNWWQSWDNALHINKEALLALMNRDLTYQGSLYPICSLFRIRKFIQRGWTINAGQILKMAWQVSKLDLEDPTVLEDQLVGVDSAYFLEIIRALKRENPDRVDHAYLMQLIDKIF
jgi:hypothetical protein